MFHKFLGMAGRALRPIMLGNDPNAASQHLWSDAVFIREIFKIPDLPSDKLLKLGFLAFLYGSPDVAFHCFKIHDDRHATNIQTALLQLGS